MKRIAYVGAMLAASVGLVPEVTACGGCYNEFEVSDLRTEPAMACVGLAASEVDQCTGDYDVSVQNDCAESLVIGGQTIGAMASGRLRGSDVPTDAMGRHSVAGMLGAAAVVVSWVLVDTST